MWVVDFPMFVGRDADGHARSRPTTRSPARTPTTSTSSSPTRCRCARKAYDLVLNGWELGSGSIRIHEPDLQQRIFDLLGIAEEEAQRRFGFFLTPFGYGAPPHGGFAFGIDRLVAILAGEENIREVIAFPKPQSGVDPMTHAPTPVDDRPARATSASAPPAQDLTDVCAGAVRSCARDRSHRRRITRR